MDSLIDVLRDEGEDDADEDTPTLLMQSPYLTNEDFVKTLKSKVNTFKLISMNIQSLNAKIDDLNIYLQLLRDNLCSLDLICLQETWLTDDCELSHLELDEYNLISKARSCSRHGGVAFYLKKEYSYSILPVSSKSNIWDGISIEVTVKESYNVSRKVVIVNIYRPPRNIVSNYQTFTDELNELMSKYQRTRQEVIIVGDFNIDLLKVKDNHNYRTFFETVICNGFIPKITLPTRLSQTHGTLIDNIFCKLSHNFSETTAGILLNNISDHQPCFISLDYLKLKSFTKKYIKIYKSDPVSIANFKEEIKQTCSLDRLGIDVNGDPNQNYDKINDQISFALKKHLPTKTVKASKHKHGNSKWITSGIIRSIKHRDNLYRQLKHMDPSHNLYQNCKTHLETYNRILRQNIRNAKKLYYSTCFNKFTDDMKKTWDNIKDILNKSKSKKDYPEYFKINEQEETNSVNIANAFNDYFLTIGKTLADSIITPQNVSYKNFLQNPSDKNFKFELTNVDEVIKVIDKLKAKTSRGIDGISNKLLKSIKKEIAPCITKLINNSFKTNIFPDRLKYAKITPILKKGNETLLENYRPISILTTISKVFEKIIHKQLLNFFLQNKLLHRSQYGFRPQHSTESAALELIDHILTKMDKNEVPINIYLDLSKAFDTLDHQILLDKLQYYGIRNDALKLIENYFKNRKQCVFYNEIYSESKEITVGVPQGSILGPLFFIIYMNDIVNSSSCFNTILYADDTTLNTTLSYINALDNTETLDTIFNNELAKIDTWLKVNKLSLNTEKTKAMLFHTPNRKFVKPNLKINEHNIEFVDQFNFLGIIFDKYLNWNHHIDMISKKVSRSIGILNRLKRYLPQAVLLTLYNTLILPHFNYGILLWGWKSDGLARLQKKAIRVITNSRYNEHTEPLFKKLNLLKVTHISMLHDLKFCYKLQNVQLPEYFYNWTLQRQNEIHSYNTRNRNHFQIPIVKHAFAKHNIRNKIPYILNETPQIILDKIYTHCFNGFKNYVKQYYISTYQTTCNIRNCYVCQR